MVLHKPEREQKLLPSQRFRDLLRSNPVRPHHPAERVCLKHQKRPRVVAGSSAFIRTTLKGTKTRQKVLKGEGGATMPFQVTSNSAT